MERVNAASYTAHSLWKTTNSAKRRIGGTTLSAQRQAMVPEFAPLTHPEEPREAARYF